MKFLQIILSPLAFIYKSINALRNYLYNIGHFKSFSFTIPVVSVGNLTVGGTGKTPHVEYLIRFLTQTYKVAVLSRGYGRKTKGFLMADETSSASTIGDEPMQYFKKYGDKVSVTVCENRAFAVPCIMYEEPDTQVILLDDAFQHRKITPQFNILLSDFNRPFYEDFLLPAGLLRETRGGAKRADVVIVSKCPSDISLKDRQIIKSKIQIYAPKSPVFFTTINYGNPISLNNKFDSINNFENVVLFAGLANIEPLQSYVQTKYTILETIDFNDHYSYKTSDINKVLEKYHSYSETDKCIVTTEKDMVKLISPELNSLIQNVPIFYIPIEICFIDGELEFQQLLLAKL